MRFFQRVSSNDPDCDAPGSGNTGSDNTGSDTAAEVEAETPVSGVAAPPFVLDGEMRERIGAALARQDLGDTIARQLFLAALDYQLGAFGGRLADAHPSVRAALTHRACSEAARALTDEDAVEAARICQGFLADLVRSYDACFERAPSAEPDGAFVDMLELLRERLGISLAADRALLEQAILTVVSPGP